MSEETPDLKPEKAPASEALPSPLRCWYGTAVAGAMSLTAYLLTSKVIAGFASKPPTGNELAVQIGITVRTLIMGLFTMATGVFGLIAVGLFILGLQSLFSGQKTSPPGDA
ncbi:hypothetical protein NIES970_07700 [[Synechococcus] sp. NIES-970]|nr:hypothetical protein NIES970_07700 [[Synechococcus] sp. NIES-970]